MFSVLVITWMIAYNFLKYNDNLTTKF